MAQTEAQGVRHRKSFLQLKDGKTATMVAGYARQLSHPAYENLIRSESVLRRLVPVLIVLFLAIAGAARWVSLNSQHEQIIRAVDAEMHFIAELVHERLLRADLKTIGAAEQIMLQNLLADAVPHKYLEHDRQVVLNDSEGNVIARIPMHWLSQ